MGPMKWQASRSPEGRDAPALGDGLDESAWKVLCESTQAAHRGDARAHVAPLLRYEQETPDDTGVGFYLWYLLRYRVLQILGRRPSREDLQMLAERFYPQFSALIRGNQRQLEDTLLTVFAFADDDRKVSGGNAIVIGSAALGVLLDDPKSRLTEMRPHLAEWWQRNKAEFEGAQRSWQQRK